MSCNAEPYAVEGEDTILMKLSPALQQHWQNGTATRDLNIDQRLAQVRLLLDDARQRGNPDAYGQAEVLLQPLLSDSHDQMQQSDDTAEIWFLMAYIKQHNHQFAAALSLLDELLMRHPEHYNARLQRAQIHLITADYEAAQEDCRALAYRISDAMLASCVAQVAAVSGQAEQAYELVQQMLANLILTSAERFELQLTGATVAEQLGHDDVAKDLYLDLLAQAPDSQFVLQHLADLYLRTLDTASALSLLQTRLAENSGLELQVTQLRALMASEHLEAAHTLRTQLAAQFAIASVRGAADFPHKEYARFTLHVTHDKVGALQAARDNWQVQKEPDDLLLLTEAAIAAGDKQTLTEVQRWLDTKKLQDQRIEKLLQQAGP